MQARYDHRSIMIVRCEGKLFITSGNGYIWAARGRNSGCVPIFTVSKFIMHVTHTIDFQYWQWIWTQLTQSQ